MRRLYVEIPEPAFREAARRAEEQRRSPRDQVGYDLERLYCAPSPETPAQGRIISGGEATQ